MNFVRNTITLLKRTFREFSEDNCLRMAAAISYYTIFSLPAMMVIVISVAGFFVNPEDIEGRILRETRSVVGNRGAEQLKTIIEQADEPGKGLLGTVVGIGILLFGATGVMTQLQAALNDAWDVEKDSDSSAVKSFLIKRLISLAMLLTIAFVLMVSLVMSTMLSAFGEQLDRWLQGSIANSFLRLGGGAVTYLITAALFTLMYKYLPDNDVRWRDVWLGGALTGLLFTIGKRLLGMYLGGSDIASTYGAAGSMALILIWVYYSGAIVLFGAEFTQVWSRRHDWMAGNDQ